MKRKKSARPKPAEPGTQPAGFSRSSQIVFAAFFPSGLAGLMHQVVWAKLLVQLIGALLLAHAPLFLHPDARTALVAGVSLRYGDLESDSALYSILLP